MTQSQMLLIPTILCGGAGARLWPVSREQSPKPFIRLGEGKSLLQNAFLRGACLPGVQKVFTVTNRDFVFKIKQEYQEISHLIKNPLHNTFILEPLAKNTGPAIALACLQAMKSYGTDPILLVLAADHIIANQNAFSDAALKAYEQAQQGKIVTFGIQPTSPETGYGYIEYDENHVIRFVEKPDLETAESYLASNRFLWNSGMFCFKAKTMLEEIEKHSPEIIQSVKDSMEKALTSSTDDDTQIEVQEEWYKHVPSNSIDYAVMEKSDKVSVVAADIGWSDIGCWKALGDLTSPDVNNNRIQGEVLLNDAKNCTIKSGDRLIATVGVENLIIVDTVDALLVANKSRAQEVKNIYETLKEQGHNVHKFHRTVSRPWGTYTVLEEGPHFKIKRIEVRPGGKLSLQKHQHRSEHWFCVNGTAKVLNDDQELILNINESTYIPAGHKHRLENHGTDQLILIEVQTGSYLGEDDIVRFEDVYGRVA
jgi:mannose-1-phosphate guanylyltransferase